MTPDFLIAGAYRSGTTALRRWIEDHDQIYMPALAEPSYFAFDDGRYPAHLLQPGNDPFNRTRIDSREAYLSLFDDAPAGSLTGECSPEYLRAHGSAARIAAEAPDCRIIFSLRNPVDRLISDWRMCRRDGVETLDLESALVAIPGRAEAGEFGAHYVETSQYSAQLQEFLGVFPADQLLVLIFEEWTMDPLPLRGQVADFLGVRADGLAPTPELRNRSGAARNELVAGLYRMRRKLAPYLGPVVPKPLSGRADALMAKGLVVDEDLDAERELVARHLDGEVERVESLIGRRIPLWTR